MATNALLVRWPGGWRWVENVPLGAIRRERLAGLTVPSEAEVDTVGARQIDILGDVREQITAEISPRTPEDQVGTGYVEGDRVTMPDRAGDGQLERVMSTTSRWDGQRVDTAVQVKDVVLMSYEAFAQVVTKQTAGALDGTTRAATPVAQVTSTPAPCCADEDCTSVFTLETDWWPPGNYSGLELDLIESGTSAAFVGNFDE